MERSAECDGGCGGGGVLEGAKGSGESMNNSERGGD